MNKVTVDSIALAVIIIRLHCCPSSNSVLMLGKYFCYCG